MRRIIQAMVVASLFTGTQAMAEDAPILLPAQWTYADSSTGGGLADAFPGNAKDDPIVLESQSTHADGQPAGALASAFPGSAREDPAVVESKSTYADRFVIERNMHAQGASDPALSD